MDFLLERCFHTEREEMETMENVNKLLLQNVLPLHVAACFMGKTIRNQVTTTEVDTYMICEGQLDSSSPFINRKDVKESS